MICDKLPENKAEIIAQLAKQKISGLEETAIFLTSVGKFGQWNEQKVDKEYMMRIRPYIIEILGELKARGHNMAIRYNSEDLQENETVISCIRCENNGRTGVIRIMHSDETPCGDPWLSAPCDNCGHTNGY